jgi:hypothetical protein
VIRRRAFVAGTIALASFPAGAAKAPPPPKASLIHWPGPGHDLHGFMAIPAKARGRQPAVLVLGPAEDYARAVTVWIATIGFVACWPKSNDPADLLATIRWLATNAYGTGKVAAVLLGMADRLAPIAPSLTCAVTVGAKAEATGLPLLALDRLAPDMPADYARADAFLKEYLGWATH